VSLSLLTKDMQIICPLRLWDEMFSLKISRMHVRLLHDQQQLLIRHDNKYLYTEFTRVYHSVELFFDAFPHVVQLPIVQTDFTIHRIAQCSSLNRKPWPLQNFALLHEGQMSRLTDKIGCH
jgi:hypothetical protein